MAENEKVILHSRVFYVKYIIVFLHLKVTLKHNQKRQE